MRREIKFEDFKYNLEYRHYFYKTKKKKIKGKIGHLH